MAAKRNRTSTSEAPIALHQATNIPLDKLVLSEANVRSIGADDKAAIADLANSIERFGLLESLMVRPLSNGKTGMYEVTGGGRRLRALQLLVKQNRLAADAPTPCIPKTDGIAEEDSLAENSDREPLHPLDEFRAFAALRAKGQGDEQIAAAFRVTPAVVKQRLRLASASPKLLEAYASGEMELDALMAYCLTEDHARQEQVFKQLKKGGNHNDWTVRRMLTEVTVESSDRRVRFVGIDAYAAAGGPIMRDLFRDDADYLQDPTLLTRLVDDKLTALRDGLLAKGWKWVETAVEVPYEDMHRLRQLQPDGPALTRKQEKQLQTLVGERADLTHRRSRAAMSDKALARLDALNAEITEMRTRPPKFSDRAMARSGVFVSIDHDGNPSIRYGYVRKEDEPKTSKSAKDAAADTEAEVPASLSDSLVQDLTSYRTVALRNALAQDFDAAFLAVLHAMCLGIFYRRGNDAALQIRLDQSFPATAPGLAEWGPAKDIDARHAGWTEKLPRAARDLWAALQQMDQQDRSLLFAHCASRSVNAVRLKHNPREEAIRNAHQIAHAVSLDMIEAGFVTTVDTYLGRVNKARILDAVREAKGGGSVQLIDNLKKGEMATEAQRLLAGTPWLPEPLRLPDADTIAAMGKGEEEDGEELPKFLNQEEEDDTAQAA